MYFTFLFLLRAVNKAKHILLNFDYRTENTTNDIIVKEIIENLLSSTTIISDVGEKRDDNDVMQCKNGFDGNFISMLYNNLQFNN